MGTVTVTVVSDDTKQDIKTVTKTTIELIKFVFRYKEAQKYAWMTFLTTVVKSLFTFAITIVPGLLINELIGEKRKEIIVFYILFVSLNAALKAVINRFFSVKCEKYKNIVSSGLIREYDLKSACLDYEELEKAEIQAKSSRVRGTVSVALSIVDNLFAIFSSILLFLGSIAIFSTINPFLLLIVIAVVIINAVITKSVNKKLFDNNVKRSQKSLYQSYLMLVLHYINYAKEVRLYNSKDFFANGLFENRKEINEISVDDTKIQSNSSILFGITNFFQTILMYLYFVYKIVFGSMQVGGMLIYINSINIFSSSFSGIINGYLNLARNSMSDREMLDYMNKQSRQYQLGSTKPIITGNSVFEFKNVTFKYSGSDRYALENINLKFRINDRLCIVGENGAGKSTFIKLLLRLYLPTSGEILLDGININSFDYEQYLKLFATVFQDYQIYPISLRENIAFSKQCNDEDVLRCINQVGLAGLISKLPKGIETSIYKWVDAEGFEPSGGESQRIAIARALYHGGEIYILDEPTAALDPNAEYDIYMQFHSMIQGKSAILVTHRLSAVQLADKVAVFADGHVTEYGTHAELYAKGGIYTEMFDKQARFYQDLSSTTKETDK